MSKIQDALKKMQSRGDRIASDVRANRRDKGGKIAAIAIAAQAAANVEQEEIDGEAIEIDLESLQAAGLIAPAYHENLIANQFREIKRPLIANAYGKRVAQVEDGNLIFVTSAIAGEGKSFTSLNLAISIAQEQDLAVLLVDADVVKPRISNVLGIAEMPGLLDHLEGEQKAPESLVVRTDIGGLSVLTAGAPRENATELLAGSRMEYLVQELATRNPYRVVIFDTPPLLQTSEAKVLASLAGQVVLVIKAGATSLGAVSDALQILGDENAINLVLNQATATGNVSQYDYRYGYGFSETDQTSSKESVLDS